MSAKYLKFSCRWYSVTSKNKSSENSFLLKNGADEAVEVFYSSYFTKTLTECEILWKMTKNVRCFKCPKVKENKNMAFYLAVSGNCTFIFGHAIQPYLNGNYYMLFNIIFYFKMCFIFIQLKIKTYYELFKSNV